MITGFIISMVVGAFIAHFARKSRKAAAKKEQEKNKSA